MTLQIPTPGNTITEHIRRARDERDVVSLIRAGLCMLRQGRLAELLYGAYCETTARPSAVRPGKSAPLLAALYALERCLTESEPGLRRNQLIDAFRHRYAVTELPNDFHGCRIKESGNRVPARSRRIRDNSARLAVVSRDRCDVFNPYALTHGVRHIHMVYPTGVNGEVFVTTGDARKVLDRYAITSRTSRLMLRYRRRLGGYTAAAQVDGRFFFGTDFSGRPNTSRHCKATSTFPADAYRKWVVSFTTLWQRYLVVLSLDIVSDLRGRESRTVSVFDTRERAFVLCEPWSALFGTRNTQISTAPPGAATQ